ncbi:MAG: hypothetical protein AUK34_09500 [Ignavibacteria bacterium CG2_30_36_16]|nr:DUF4249 family protein [Ignavibacteria bacterium]OIP58311.1 MAG: hypothetical protein AUK34_09500 [Ignavibacteria bacterium CG2_30_36_16]PJB01015.1 MAG: hypothetical protein CO127_05930 [Ignavibacteria bacterium CG_4_9_14_3_um_filter_36_18]
MKKIITLILLGLFSIAFISCEENFTPKTDFKEKFIVNCIVRGDTSFQTLTILKSYDVPGYDALVNTDDPFIYAADVRMWQGDDVYVLQRGERARKDTSRYKTPFKFYSTNLFQPSERDLLEIKVILPDGKTLFGETKLPEYVTYTGDKGIPSPESDNFALGWTGNHIYTNYLPRFSVRYRVTENNVTVTKQKVVPMSFIKTDGKLAPFYPKFSTNTRLQFTREGLDSAFYSLSGNDPNKAKYIILGGVLELIIFDDNLSKYYSSQNGFLDDYTVRLDEADYSNIQGGLGIFGSMLKQELFVGFKEEYITSFGYSLNVNQ